MFGARGRSDSTLRCTPLLHTNRDWRSTQDGCLLFHSRRVQCDEYKAQHSSGENDSDLHREKNEWQKNE
jgi:hypothetical protein